MGEIHPLTLYTSLLVGGGGGHSCIGNTHMSVFSFSRTTVGHDESTSSVNGRPRSASARITRWRFLWLCVGARFLVFFVFSLLFVFCLVVAVICASAKQCPTPAAWMSKRSRSRRVRVAR